MKMSEERTSTRKSKKSKVGMQKHQYSTPENIALSSYKEKLNFSLKPLKFKEMGEDNNTITVEVDCEDTKLLAATLARTTGACSIEFGKKLLEQAAIASRTSQEASADVLAAVAAAMLDIAPRDILEGLLVAQMLSVHNQTMACLRKALVSEQPVQIIESYRNQAIALMRTYVSQMEVLKKYRTGGQQKVTVEHVHVNEGAQAIVGSVTGGGKGRNDENRG